MAARSATSGSPAKPLSSSGATYKECVREAERGRERQRERQRQRETEGETEGERERASTSVVRVMEASSAT